MKAIILAIGITLIGTSAMAQHTYGEHDSHPCGTDSDCMCRNPHIDWNGRRIRGKKALTFQQSEMRCGKYNGDSALSGKSFQWETPHWKK